MKKLLTLIIVTFALQSCALTGLIPNYNYPSVDVTINIDLQPAWGPIGYDYAAYYYMPEINIYYDVNLSRFYYQSNNRWIAAQYLPPSYRVYDLFKIYKVVINYDNPWEYNRTHRSQYKHYRDDRSQIPIRLSNDSRYRQSWDNLRPWVDPNRRSNSKNDYKQHSQHKPSVNKPNDKNQQNGYRGEEGYRPNQGAAAGGSYRDKNNNTPSYRGQQPQKPSNTTKATTDKKQSSSPTGVSSRGNARTTTSTSSKPEAPKNNTRSTSSSSSSSSSGDSYRTTTSTGTATRGR